MIADFHDCNADCPPDCKYKDTTSAHSRFKIYHFDNYDFKQHILNYTRKFNVLSIMLTISNCKYYFVNFFLIEPKPDRLLSSVSFMM